ncbi:DUF2207 domain-containing protein, partial [Nitratifractor sp.]|uniref:DUF2207 domain-containing protein n=1 Tax=Nitratifractor sp. TaxID=2268144 RepID=UPI0025ED0578
MRNEEQLVATTFPSNLPHTRLLRRVLIALALFFSFIALSLHAGEDEAIRDYNITVRLLSNGSLHITEAIAYDFNGNRRHGIYREIPTKMRLLSLLPPADLQMGEFQVTMDGHVVRVQKERYNDEERGLPFIRLIIGDYDHTYIGVHLYHISYRVGRAVLAELKGDKLRWNLIGTDWEVPIRHYRARIVLPDILDRTHVTVRAWEGYYGSKEPPKTPPRWLNDRTLLLSGEGLERFQGVTVQIDDPNGILRQAGAALLRPPLWGWGYLLLLAALLVWFWRWAVRRARLFGLHSLIPSVGIAPQYHPPEGLSVFQSAYLLQLDPLDKALGPALVELAVNGYLTIAKDGDKRYLLRYTGKAPASDLTSDQLQILQSLFSKSDRFVIDPKSKDSYETLQKTLTWIEEGLEHWGRDTNLMVLGMWESATMYLRSYLKTLFLPFFLVLLWNWLRYESWSVLLATLTEFIFLSIFFYVIVRSWQRRSAVIFLLGMVFVGAFWAYTWFGGLKDALIDWPAAIYLTLLFVPLIYYYPLLGRYGPRGEELRRKLFGWKRFVKRVDKDRIRRFVQEDPVYLDRTMPYAMLFGVSDAWEKLYDLFTHRQSSRIWGGVIPDESVASFNDATFDAASGSGLPGSAGGFAGGTAGESTSRG